MNEQGPGSPGEGSRNSAAGQEALTLYEEAKADAEAPPPAAADAGQDAITTYEKVMAAEAETKRPSEAADLASPITVDPAKDPLRAYEQAAAGKAPEEKSQSGVPQMIAADQPPFEPPPPSVFGEAVKRKFFDQQWAKSQSTAEGQQVEGTKEVEKPPFAMPRSKDDAPRDWSQASMEHDFSRAAGDDGIGR